MSEQSAGYPPVLVKVSHHPATAGALGGHTIENLGHLDVAVYREPGTAESGLQVPHGKRLEVGPGSFCLQAKHPPQPAPATEDANNFPPRVHQLKTNAAPFDATWRGLKTHELRRDDRGYAVGDLLILREGEVAGTDLDGNLWKYTGRYLAAEVTHITRCADYMTLPAGGFVVMSIRVLSQGRLP